MWGVGLVGRAGRVGAEVGGRVGLQQGAADGADARGETPGAAGHAVGDARAAEYASAMPAVYLHTNTYFKINKTQ